MKRGNKSLRDANENRQFQIYSGNYSLDSTVQQKIIFIRVAGNIFPIYIGDIIFCQSNDPFVTFIFYSSNGELVALAEKKIFPAILALYTCSANPVGHTCLSWRKRLTMNDVDAMFNSLHFCQVHKSYLINLLQLKKVVLRNSERSEAVMSNGDILPLSAKGKSLFAEKIGKL
jgi:hypothetical protein